MNLGILHTGIRGDEKLIIQACENANINYELIDVRKKILDPLVKEEFEKYDIFLERCISSVKGNAFIEFLSNLNIPVVNNKQVMNICNDKFQTATVLSKHGIPVVESTLVFNEKAAKKAVKGLGGYPVVIKSRTGSWGRLITKVNDEEALEGIIDHKSYMGPEHSAIVIQQYIDKPGRDIRAFVIGGNCVAAIYRSSEHWITNTARGGEATNCTVTADIQAICQSTSNAIGGGLLALDLFETDEGLIVNEVNHTMEFKNSEKPTGVSISEEIIEYCINFVNKNNGK
jgi:[lysine-biosynthesis-protein LysW]--L-2-aminoadipate ligase